MAVSGSGGPRPRITIGRMMALVALAATCFALEDWPNAAATLIPPSLASLSPHPFRWATLESAATGVWLLHSALAFSDAFVDSFELMGLFFAGVTLGISWLARWHATAAVPRSRSGMAARLFTPTAGLLGLLLLLGDFDFRARLALSEPALRDCHRRMARGERRSYWGSPRWVGLFRAETIEERGGCLLVTTGGFAFSSSGIAHSPGPLPPTWRHYEFRHVRGPWWRFVWSD